MAWVKASELNKGRWVKEDEYKKITQRKAVQEEYNRHLQEAEKQAKKLAKLDAIANIPKEILKGAIVRPALSLAEVPKNIYGAITGKNATFGEVNVPLVGNVESYQNEAQRVSEQIVAGQKPVRSILKPIGETILDAGSMGVGGQVAKQGVKQGVKAGIKTGLKTGAGYGAGYGTTQALGEGQGVKDSLKTILTGSVIGAGGGAIIGGIGGALTKGKWVRESELPQQTFNKKSIGEAAGKSDQLVDDFIKSKEKSVNAVIKKELIESLSEPKGYKPEQKVKLYNDIVKPKIDEIGEVADDEVVVFFQGDGKKGQYVNTDPKRIWDYTVDENLQVKKVKEKDLSLTKLNDRNDAGYRILKNDISESTPEAKLIQEAKKYKSAEEFVKAQGGGVKNLYEENINTFKGGIVKLYHQTNETMPKFDRGSVFFNTFKRPATYGENTIEAVVDIKKPLNMGSEITLQADQPRLIEMAKKKGYDSIIYSHDFSNQGKITEVIVLDPKKISVSLTKSQLEDIWNKAQKETPGVSFLDRNAERVYKKTEKEKNKLARAEYRQEKELLEESVAFHDEYGEMDNQYQAFKKLYNRYKTGKVRQAFDSIDVEEVKTALEGKVKANEIDNIFYSQDMYDNEVLDSFMTMLEKEKKIKAMRFKKPDPELGEFRTRGLARGIEAKAVENKLARRFGDLPIYKTVKVKDQADQTAKLISDDYERALKVAMGEEKAPEGLLPESVMVGIEEEAIKRGDVETLRKLATSSKLVSEATEMGQRIRMLAERNPESTVSNINRVVSERAEFFKKKTGQSVEEASQAVIKEIKSKVRQPIPTKADWESFITNITC